MVFHILTCCGSCKILEDSASSKFKKPKYSSFYSVPKVTIKQFNWAYIFFNL